METVPTRTVPPLSGGMTETEASSDVDRIWRARGSRRRDRVDPRIWDHRDMRFALATHDILTVYELLQRFGMSQRAIAAMTGQSQSEISEILGKGRTISSRMLLIRIAMGSGCHGVGSGSRSTTRPTPWSGRWSRHGLMGRGRRPGDADWAGQAVGVVVALGVGDSLT
jgi:predicted XRE-type DNA-binding protein